MYARMKIALEVALLTWNFAHLWVRLRVKRSTAASRPVALCVQPKFLNSGVEKPESSGILILENADSCDRI